MFLFSTCPILNCFLRVRLCLVTVFFLNNFLLLKAENMTFLHNIFLVAFIYFFESNIKKKLYKYE